MRIDRREILRCLPAALASTTGPVPAAPAQRVYWSGRSGGYRWRFTSADLTANGPGRSYSLRKARFPSPPEMDARSFYSATAAPLSLVGTLLSYREEEYWSGGAHPSGAITYASVDAAAPQRRPRLTDWFPDAHLRDALWADSVVRRTLSNAGVRSKPSTARSLVRALELRQFGGEEGIKYSFSGDLLSRFAFHHLEGERVAVRLNVSWGAEIYRFQSTEIGLLLPIPAPLRGALRRAESGQEGFLARAARARFKGRSALLLEVGRE